MIALEEIRQLPFREKLRVMEAIWDDICREEQHLEVPEWHKEVLDERGGFLPRVRANSWIEAKRRIDEATQ